MADGDLTHGRKLSEQTGQLQRYNSGQADILKSVATQEGVGC